MCGSEAASERGHCLSPSHRLWECVLRVVGSAALEVLPWGAWWNADELGRKEALIPSP